MIFLMQAARLNRQEMVDAIRHGVTSTETTMSWRGLAWLIAFLAVLAIVLRLVGIWSERKSRPVANDPLKLFRDLMSGLRIAHADQGLLKQLARDLKMPHPAVMLMSPRLFDETVEKWISGSARNPGDRHLGQLRNIRSRVFEPVNTEILPFSTDPARRN